MIIGTGITKSFTGDPIIDEIGFKIGNNKKVAIVGKNGCGKSTLLKIIAGEFTLDTGSLKIDDEIISYIPQELDFPDMTVTEYIEKKLENSWDFYKVEVLVDELEFTNFNPDQQIKTLSEGQKMKLKILESLLSDPTVLLIDEPTNHLDIEGILWFENYIKHLKKTVLMISHDREFLNRTVDEIWEIENKKLIVFAGNYDFYKEEKLRLINKWNDEYARFVKKKEQLEKLLALARKTSGSKRGAVSAVKTRIDREIEQNTKEKYVSKKMKKINFESGVTHAKLMVKFTEVNKSFSTTVVYNDLTFEIRGGEKIWLFGPNGAGKSTLVKLIMGDEKPTNGNIKIGDNIKIGYFAQKQSSLNMEKDILSFFIEETGCFFQDAFTNLKKFMFDREDLKKKIGNLSLGQRARFSFAIFAYKNYDMLILDEPDNHLDIETKEVLEESLKQYQGTLLLVSHDRFFVERVGVEKILNLKAGVLSEY